MLQFLAISRCGFSNRWYSEFDGFSNLSMRNARITKKKSVTVIHGHTLILLTKPAYLKKRYRKDTIWARVQVLLGLKVVALVPLVMPFSAAHRTALA